MRSALKSPRLLILALGMVSVRRTQANDMRGTQDIKPGKGNPGKLNNNLAHEGTKSNQSQWTHGPNAKLLFADSRYRGSWTIGLALAIGLMVRNSGSLVQLGFWLESLGIDMLGAWDHILPYPTGVTSDVDGDGEIVADVQCS